MNANSAPGPGPTVSIVYLVGVGRSGTTLLSRLLDLEPGYRAVGEVRGVGDAVSLERLCGCGVPQQSCPLWQPVIDRLRDPQHLQGWTAAAFASQRDQLNAFLRPTHAREWDSAALVELRTVYEHLGADGDVLVDESKNPWLGYLLSQQPWADVRFIELLRPPTDVLTSMGTAKGYQPVTPREAAGKHWLRTVLTCDLMRRRTAAPWLRLPYRDLVNEPEATLTRILGEAPRGLRRDGDQWTFESPSAHILRSNSDKLRRGRDTIRPMRGAPSAPTADAGRWERLADRYANRWLKDRLPVVRSWSPAVVPSTVVSAPQQRIATPTAAAPSGQASEPLPVRGDG